MFNNVIIATKEVLFHLRTSVPFFLVSSKMSKHVQLYIALRWIKCCPAMFALQFLAYFVLYFIPMKYIAIFMWNSIWINLARIFKLKKIMHFSCYFMSLHFIVKSNLWQFCYGHIQFSYLWVLCDKFWLISLTIVISRLI